MADQEPPPDPRPRPQYGERAPEGWKWVPPKDAPNPDGVHPVSHRPAAAPARSAPEPAGARRTPQWDRPVTMLLLVLGLIGMMTSIGIMTAMPESIQMLHTQNNLGTYTPGPSIGGLILAGQISQGVVWALSAALSVRRLTRGRTAFFLPVIAGVVSAIVLLGFAAAILYQDPALLSYYNKG